MCWNWDGSIPLGPSEWVDQHQLRSDPSPVVDSWGENDRGVSFTFGAGLSVASVYSAVYPLRGDLPSGNLT